MKEIDTGTNKVKKICDLLRQETLEPAHQEAARIIEQAKVQAEDIVSNAKQEAARITEENKREMQKRKTVFLTSLQQAGKQTLEDVKSHIEQRLFHPAVSRMLLEPLSRENVVEEIVQVLIEAIRKEGVDTELDIVIPKSIKKQTIIDRLFAQMGKDLQGSTIEVGPIHGGGQVRLRNNHIMIDISDTAIQEWLAQYLRKDFYDLVFGDG